jgi:hypothetical protein
MDKPVHVARRELEAELIAAGVEDLPPPDAHLIRACKRVKVQAVGTGADGETILKAGPVLVDPRFYVRPLSQNQQVPSCCRNVENHEFSAWYSSPADAAKGVPDVYILHCQCGRVHRNFMLGGGTRPFWEIR